MKDRELVYKKIPDATIDHYISGFEALNIADEKGLIADWHPLTFWTGEEGEEVPLYTKPILQEKGICMRKIPFSEKPVFIASFPRAIADLIYHEYETYPFRFQNIVEEFLSEEERLQLFGYLLEIQQERNIEEFLIQEFPKEYYELNSDDQLEQREK